MNLINIRGIVSKFQKNQKSIKAINYHLKLGAIGVYVSLAARPSWAFRLRVAVAADVLRLRM